MPGKSYYGLVFLLPLLLLTALPATGQPLPGDCVIGEATADLDINNVRARLYNNGGLFWRGAEFVYTVPKNTSANAIFASGIWLGGLVNGELRFAGTTYGPFEYYPGPLDDAGNPPDDCASFDHIYTITRSDVETYEQAGTASADLLEWPAHLGAPVDDGDGISDNYNLAAGDRPKLYGDQQHWWVMNDAGGSKEWSGTAPFPLEVQVTAYASAGDGPINNTTFYRYKLIYKGETPLEMGYFGLWADPDLGDGSDDFVGSDPERNMGFVYNGRDHDQGFDGYGDTPPALGYVIVEGFRADDDGEDNDGNGSIDEPGERRGMSKFISYWGSSMIQGDPDGMTDEPYHYLQGIWQDGTQMTFGGTGLGGTEPTDFMFPDYPPHYWSEENMDNQGQRNTPSNRLFLMSTGPLTLQPGETQDMTFAIVWSRSTDRLSSVTQLKDDVDALFAPNASPVGTDEETGPPRRFALLGNYPNPFNPTTTVRFDLPQAAEVTLAVYDVLGRKVMTVGGQTQAAGTGRQLQVDGSRLASGLYLYRITAQSTDAIWQETGRFVLVK